MNDDLRAASTWEGIYTSGEAGWDLGAAAPPFEDLLATPPEWLAPGRLVNPGCGRGHDAAFFAARGFDVTAVDFADTAITAARAYAEAAPRLDVVQADLFDLPSLGVAPFDLWLEHTCFCAIPVERRPEYAEVARAMVRPGGVVFGLFYRFDPPDDAGPPFALSETELLATFADGFERLALETPHRSHAARQGRERLAAFRRR